MPEYACGSGEKHLTCQEFSWQCQKCPRTDYGDVIWLGQDTISMGELTIVDDPSPTVLQPFSTILALYILSLFTNLLQIFPISKAMHFCVPLAVFCVVFPARANRPFTCLACVVFFFFWWIILGRKIIFPIARRTCITGECGSLRNRAHWEEKEDREWLLGGMRRSHFVRGTDSQCRV